MNGSATHHVFMYFGYVAGGYYRATGDNFARDERYAAKHGHFTA